MPPALPELDEDSLRKLRKPVSLIQLADFMGVTRRTLYTHIEKGALKVVKRRGVIRVTPSEARRYAGVKPLAKRERPSPPGRQISAASV